MFAASPESPLDPDLRVGFEGLDYYPPDPGLVFVVPLHPGDLGEISVDTSDQRHKVYRRAGVVALHVDGVPLTLTVYDTGHPGLFIPFRDTTAGIETYGAGRYLDIDPNDDGTITVDFNQAYNPYCAYGGGYSCPLPPTENWLPVPIRAGERAFAAPGNLGPTNMAEERGGAN
jgi:uncharacterized protein (DUF1684 family)